jgi:hypothetical protein
MSGGAPGVRAPSNPRDLAVTALSGQLELAWNPPYDTGGTPLTGYRVVLNPGNIIQNLNANTTTTQVAGLSNGTSYSVELVALNSAGSSPSLVATASPTGPWVMGGTGALVGAPPGWGGNGGVNNLRGAYAATAPPAGITNGYQLGANYCGVLPVLQAQDMAYEDLTVINTNGTFIDATGAPSGTMTYNSSTGLASINVTRNGAILEYLDIPGQVFVNANNVIIRYCRINATDVITGGSYIIKTYTQYTGLIIQYCEIISGYNISAAVPPYGEYIARYCDVWNVSNDAFKVGSNTLVEFNWVHGLNKAPAAHSDATQWTSGDNISIRFNRFEPYQGTADQEAYQLPDIGNGAVIVGKMTGHGSWFVFEDNYADGCTYPIRAGQASPDIKGWTTEHAFWRRNRVGLKFAFGPYDNDIQASADQVFENTNVWHISGQTYHYDTEIDTWYYSHVVIADTPVATWASSNFEEVP